MFLKHQVFMGQYITAVCLGLPVGSWRTQMGKKPLKMVQYQSGLCIRV